MVFPNIKDFLCLIKKDRIKVNSGSEFLILKTNEFCKKKNKRVYETIFNNNFIRSNKINYIDYQSYRNF